MKPKTKLQTRVIPHDNLFMYIKVDNNTLKINFDGLCTYLIDYENRAFSPLQFEEILQKELNDKIIGQPISGETLTSICTYIDQLSLYLTKKTSEVSKVPLSEKIKNFYKNHEEDYDKKLREAKVRNPREYNKLREKFNRRRNGLDS